MKVLTFLIVAIRVIFCHCAHVCRGTMLSCIVCFLPIAFAVAYSNTYAFTFYAFSWCECVTHHIKKAVNKGRHSAIHVLEID